MDADAHFQFRETLIPVPGIDLVHFILHLDGTVNSVRRMKRIIRGSAEYDKDPVAQKFDDRSAVLLDYFDHFFKVIVQQTDQLHRVELCADCRETAQIAHKDGDIPGFSALALPFFGRQHILGDLWRSVA